MRIAGQFATSLVLSLLASAVWAGAPAEVSVPVTVEKRLPLGMSQDAVVQPAAEQAVWHAVAQANFSPMLRNGEPHKQVVSTGPLSWSITSAGAHVVDNRTVSSADIPVLTDAEVRPREVVYDRSMGTVWFYGTNLYRYQISTRTLEKMQFPDAREQAIRKLAIGPSGLWLASAKGIFLLDAADGLLKKIGQAASAINVVAGEQVTWVATADSRLVRIAQQPSRQLTWSVSKTLPGAVAEMAQSGQSVWLLVTAKHGEQFTLAHVDDSRQQLEIMGGRYFTLNAVNGELLAGAYARQYRIDPVSNTAMAVRFDETRLLMEAQKRGAVLFTGSSYGVKDGCEIVEHAQLDLSKGWVNALNESSYH